MILYQMDSMGPVILDLLLLFMFYAMRYATLANEAYPIPGKQVGIIYIYIYIILCI